VQFPGIAARLRPGLSGVVWDPEGTAKKGLQAAGAIGFLASLPGYRVYAKTGTLSTDNGATETSRLVLARVARVRGTTGEHEAAGGVDELVAGTHRPTPRATQPVRREFGAD